MLTLRDFDPHGDAPNVPSRDDWPRLRDCFAWFTAGIAVGVLLVLVVQS